MVRSLPSLPPNSSFFSSSPSSSPSSSAFDFSDCLDIDVTSASSSTWKSEYRSHFKDHRSANRGGRRAAYWNEIAQKRTASLIQREMEERRKRGETIPEGWPAYAVRYTHREGGGGEVKKEGDMVSVLREMKTRTDIFVPVSAIKRPVKVQQGEKPKPEMK